MSDTVMKTLNSSFVSSYIETALWSSLDNEDQPLDKNYSAWHLAPETLAKFAAECAAFQSATAELTIGYTDARVAHDFWLTRNGHGAGFWDGDYLEEIGEALTRVSKLFGECNLYVGDDGRIYC